MTRYKRIALGFLALLSFAVVVPARADDPDPTGDPIGTVQDLVKVANVTATGFGPEQILVSWDNQGGQCLPVQVPCVTLANRFQIQASMDEAGPYRTVSTYTNNCLRCVTSVTLSGQPSNQNSLGSMGLRSADPRPFFVRVVPILSTPPIGPPNSKPLVDPVDIFAGRPSDPDPVVLGPKRPTDVICGEGGALDCVNVRRITLHWTDNSDEKEFWVMRAEGPANTNFGSQRHARTPENVNVFTETLDKANTVFQYRVVAVRITSVLRVLTGQPQDELSYSNCDAGDNKHDCAVTAQSAPVPSPSTPSALSATYSPPNNATLTWVDRELNPDLPYVNENEWHIEQTSDFKTSGAPDWDSLVASQVTMPGTPGQGVRTYDIHDFPLDTTRCFRVRGAVVGPAFSEYTNIACIGSTPKAPSDLVAVAASNAAVDLTWTDNSNSETGDVIERCDGICTAAGVWTEVGTAPRNATSFRDVTTAGLRTYSYRVFAVNPSGRSPSSNIAFVTTPPAPLPSPGPLQATGMQHAIRLDWTDISGETGYEIEYRSPGGNFDLLTSVGANVSTFVDTSSLGVNQTRCYQVRALDGPMRKSDPTNEACATTLPLTPPNAPSNLAVVSPGGVKNTSIELTWRDNANNETGFIIEAISFINTECASNPAVVDSRFYRWGVAPAVSGSGVTVNFTVTGLVPHSSYFFRVKATNQDGDSSYANAVTPYHVVDYPNTTACAQSAGPLRPVWTDPAQSGDAQTFRCDMTLEASDDPTDPDRVGGIRVYVNAFVPGSSLGNTDTIYVGDVPGISPDLEDDPVIVDGDGTKQAQWVIRYHFRRGFNYRLLATTYTADANKWSSATGLVDNVTVYADCPLG